MLKNWCERLRLVASWRRVDFARKTTRRFCDFFKKMTRGATVKRPVKLKVRRSGEVGSDTGPTGWGSEV